MNSLQQQMHMQI